MYLTNRRNNDFSERIAKLLMQYAPPAKKISNKLMTRVIHEAIYGGAPSFYISHDYACRQLTLRRARRLDVAGEPPHRQQMWQELDQAVSHRCRLHPDEHPAISLDFVLTNHQPSRFFISPTIARKLARALRKTCNHQLLRITATASTAPANDDSSTPRLNPRSPRRKPVSRRRPRPLSLIPVHSNPNAKLY